MNSSEFTERYLIAEVKLMQDAGIQLQLLSAMVHGVEAAGAMLDNKPFKAKGQGRKRFQLAIKKLFPKPYQEVSLQFDLYNLLRSHMAHCMLPAKTIQVFVNDEKHLTIHGESLSLSIKQLYSDYCTAMEKLIRLIETGQLKNKKIQFENLYLK